MKGPKGDKGDTGETGPQGPQGSSTPDYDSGWVDIGDKAGEYFNVVHNLNSEDIIVDIRGKTTESGGAHQKYLGLTSKFIPGWSKIYGGTGVDYGCSVVQTSDGGYALAGSIYTYAPKYDDFWLVKTDASGNMQGTGTYGTTGNDKAVSMVQTSGGGYAIVGYTDSFGAGIHDVYLVKTDSARAKQWSKTYGGASDDRGHCVVQTSDGGLVIAGYTDSFGADRYYYDVYLVKADVEDEFGLAWTDSTANDITLYRGATDIYWKYARVRIWITK